MFLLHGCQAPDGDTQAPAAYLYEDTASPDPDFSTDAVSAALQIVWDNLYSYNANVLFVAYDEVMTQSDEACPTFTYPGEGLTSWETSCAAASGTTFSGYYSQLVEDEEIEVRRFRAETTIENPDGTHLTYAGGGETQYSPERWFSSVDGFMFYDGPAAAGTWLEQGVELTMEYELNGQDQGGVDRASIQGAISGLTGDVSAVSFTDIVFPVANDSECTSEPTGSLAIRDAEGVWADVVFDLEVGDVGSYTIEEGLCDGCGTLWYGGEDLGQVCLDAALIAGPAVAPW